MLGSSYYTLSPDAFAADLNKLLTACNVIQRIEDEYVVVMFAVKPTPGAESPSVIHGVFRKTGSWPSASLSGESVSFPGIASATWVYLTDEQSDDPRAQLQSLRLDDPNLALIGPLAATLIPTVPFVSVLRAAGPVHVHVSSVMLPFKRSTITETDFIERANPGGEIDPIQIEGSATFNNTPNTWLTINAGVAIISGGIKGDQRIKIDGDKYASDPLPRAATMAGVTFHLPYDSTTPEAKWREKLGLVVAGIVTPAGGLAVGPSYGWRGFALTVAYGWISVNTSPAGKTAGDDAGQDQQP